LIAGIDIVGRNYRQALQGCNLSREVKEEGVKDKEHFKRIMNVEL